MTEDIGKQLYSVVKKDVVEKLKTNHNILALEKKIKTNTATYEDAYNYAELVGNLVSDSLKTHITADVLPDGKMYYNIAESIMRPVLSGNYETVSKYTASVQTILNRNAGLLVNGIQSDVNMNRIDGIIDKISDADDFNKVKWLLGEPVVNYSQHAVDETQKANLELHKYMGLEPVIKRVSTGKCCNWCKNLVGTYKYPDECPDDVYKRHRGCRCMVLYNPMDGRGVQDINKKELGFTSESDLKKRIEYSESAVSAKFGQKRLDRIAERKKREAEKKAKEEAEKAERIKQQGEKK